MFDLSGKRALVTGASGGIGREIAKALAAAGATVALSGTRVGALEDTAKEIGKDCPILPANLSKLDEVDKLVPAAEASVAVGAIIIAVSLTEAPTTTRSVCGRSTSAHLGRSSRPSSRITSKLRSRLSWQRTRRCSLITSRSCPGSSGRSVIRAAPLSAHSRPSLEPRRSRPRS